LASQSSAARHFLAKTLIQGGMCVIQAFPDDRPQDAPGA
jgi:hypothetical protein